MRQWHISYQWPVAIRLTQGRENFPVLSIKLKLHSLFCIGLTKVEVRVISYSWQALHAILSTPVVLDSAHLPFVACWSGWTTFPTCSAPGPGSSHAGIWSRPEAGPGRPPESVWLLPDTGGWGCPVRCTVKPTDDRPMRNLTRHLLPTRYQTAHLVHNDAGKCNGILLKLESNIYTWLVSQCCCIFSYHLPDILGWSYDTIDGSLIISQCKSILDLWQRFN